MEKVILIFTEEETYDDKSDGNLGQELRVATSYSLYLNELVTVISTVTSSMGNDINVRLLFRNYMGIIVFKWVGELQLCGNTSAANEF